MLAILTFLAATAVFPSNSTTGWMRPESFHLSIGMSRNDALKKLAGSGFEAKKGDDYEQVSGKTLDETFAQLAQLARLDMVGHCP